MKRAALVVLLQACWTAPRPQPSAPAPAPVFAQGLGHVLDGSEFRAMLDGDWTGAIDPIAGVVVLDDDKAPHNWCLPRGASYVKFEALNLKAEMISRSTSESAVVVTCAPIQRDVVECHAEGLRPHFRFVWRDGRFMLIGLARYTGQLARGDADRYEAALRTSHRCE